MSAQHTQGRLLHHPEDNIFTIGGKRVFEVQARSLDVPAAERDANAHRVAACWNACDGIPTDMLESVKGLMPAVLPYRIMREHNAQLLEALKWREQFEPRAGETSNDTFERVAEVFQGETGHLRPGKDCRMHSCEERQAAWDEWMNAGRARIRAAIAAATGAAT